MLLLHYLDAVRKSLQILQFYDILNYIKRDSYERVIYCLHSVKQL